ncbi:ORF6N domain-containing protein [Pelomonas sp. Root1444]|uniref:ORF6N domain-containing protein n=1 Tax=Pelomonas sp. Root1444 TaxID=1736464 RepID=UPI001F210E1C|nr:ORF6N domain-containing protein [Pelomonas sp. Root1444]
MSDSDQAPRGPASAQLPQADAILPRILTIGTQRVIVDAELAALYEVPTKRLNEAVKRNLGRFPQDFMFTLSAEEFALLRSQSATSSASPGHGGRRHAPRVFTEHGALMAATLLNSPAPSRCRSTWCGLLCGCASWRQPTPTWPSVWPNWRTRPRRWP